MAIIKCPECGHQTSDKAPVCPECGVEIAGKVITCPYCGEVYFKNEAVCPHCHKAISDNADSPTPEETPELNSPGAGLTTVTDTTSDENGMQNNDGKKKSNRTIIIVSAIVALLIIGICLFFYNSAQSNREQDEYTFAMQSDDPAILQAYLDNYKDAPQAHIDAVTMRLNEIDKLDEDWTNAVIAGTKSALNGYLNTHPDTPHKQEALDKIDSIDWEQCKKLNTAETYQMYIDNHYDGNHYEEAVIALNKLKSSEVSLDDRQTIANIFRTFFSSINSKDENGLTANVSDNINFLGKQNATKADVASFMHKIYKADVSGMTWNVTSDYEINKKEIGDLQYEYSTTFMVDQTIRKTDGSEEINKFRINAKLNPDSKITEMSMTKIIE